MVWRRVLVAESTSLRALHGVVQVAMGWEGIHLGSFAGGAKYYDKRFAAPYGRLKSDFASKTAVHAAVGSVCRPRAAGVSGSEGPSGSARAESHLWFANAVNPPQINAILRAVPGVKTLIVVFRPLPQTTRWSAIARASGTERASRSSLLTTSVSPARTAASAWSGRDRCRCARGRLRARPGQSVAR